jgi:predicted nucleic acid-binding protein
MIEALQGASSIYLDTAPVVYFIEENEDFCSLVEPVIEAIDGGTKQGLSSYLTLLEVLVKPLEQDRPELAEQYRDLLIQSPHMRLMDVNEAIAEEAARIRARYKFKTPDAIHLASAKLGGADVFVTNDHQLRQFLDLKVIVLRDYVGTA